MTITIGSTPVQSIYVGSTPVQAVYVGSTLVWPAGTTYYKWQNSNGVTAYTTSNTPAVGDRMAQIIGDTLCSTSQIIAVSGTSFTTYGQSLTTSSTEIQWDYVGTEALPQTQPITVYSWIHSNSNDVCITLNRNPSAGDYCYTCDYKDWWHALDTLLNVVTDGNGDVVQLIPEHAVTGTHIDYAGLYTPTTDCSYTGLNATGDASSYAFPVSSGTITDGTHTATLSNSSSVTLTANTLNFVVLGTDGVLRATTSLPPTNPGFILYYVQAELETYGLSPYWSIDYDRRNNYAYVGGA